MVISSEKYLGKIPAPTVTVCAGKKNTQMGFKDDWITSQGYPTSEIVGDICRGLHGEDIVECKERKTFNLSTSVQYASKGILGKNNLTDPKLWNPEFSYSGAGLCNQLEANITMGTSQTNEVIWIKVSSNLFYSVLVHDHNFFFLNTNPELPMNAMTVDTMKMYSFKLVQHRNMDLVFKPCNPDPQYSLTGCIKNSFSKEVGCRLHWDKWTDLTLPICDQIKQYR